MIDRDELGAWLRLLETPQLGRETIRRLLAAFGSPQAVLQASPRALREVVVSNKAALLGGAPEHLARALAQTVRWLAETADGPRAVVPLGDPRYPAALLHSPDPPLMLYAMGRLDLLGAAALAIVGSRHPTPQGRENAEAFSSHLSRAGVTVVSGLATGVDAAAHGGALDHAASTIAVVGTGLDSVYPRCHLPLARRIAQHGLMVSEYALGTPPLPGHFPRRNRIIAGMARGTLVVEATLRSGSLITARLANEAGRDVFAIPGSIHSPQARGCHALIREGAKLVETAADILDELQFPAPAPSGPHRSEPAGESPGDRFLLAALGHDPVTLDALAVRTGRSAAELATGLMTLELEGRVARLPGQLFQRLGRLPG